MKYILTALLLFRLAQAQPILVITSVQPVSYASIIDRSDYVETVTYDTQARLIPIIKTANSNIFNSPQYWLKGYVVYKTVISAPGEQPVTTKVNYLWYDRRSKIQAPYVVNMLDGDMPLNGYAFP